jgi:hypothetical protein
MVKGCACNLSRRLLQLKKEFYYAFTYKAQKPKKGLTNFGYKLDMKVTKQCIFKTSGNQDFIGLHY